MPSSAQLSVANRQRVEIAKALSQNAKLVIMDEPTAALADADARRLMEVVRRLRDRGVGIVYVSHRLPEIFALADRVTVLRDGAYVGTKPIGEVDRSRSGLDDGRPRHRPALPEGRGGAGRGRSGAARTSATATSVQRHQLSTLRAGEILGIAGLVGSGRTELALTIFGITPATAGEILRRRQAGHDPQPRRGARASASPMCRKIAACRA